MPREKAAQRQSNGSENGGGVSKSAYRLTCSRCRARKVCTVKDTKHELFTYQGLGLLPAGQMRWQHPRVQDLSSLWPDVPLRQTTADESDSSNDTTHSGD